MQLISVDSAKHTATSAIELTITADLDDGVGPQSLPYGWVVGDTHGLGPQIDAYMSARPGFAIAAYVAPTPSTNPADYPLTMRQLRQALLTFGSKPVDFVASVVAKIADPTQKALATIWYEETVTGINWSDPETQFLLAASGIPLAQASALWLKAASL